MTTYPNPWIYRGQAFDEEDVGEYIGFVYRIDGPEKSYIGKKLFNFKKRRKRKGKRDQILKVPSDWKEYYGSSDDLNEDVQKIGAEHFSRTILYLCKSKAEMSYVEAKFQFALGVLESDKFYNKWVAVKIRHRITLTPPDDSSTT